MRRLLDTIHLPKSREPFEREIAPGVRVRIRRLPARFALTARVQNALDRLRGTPRVSDDEFTALQHRLHGYRRAA